MNVSQRHALYRRLVLSAIPRALTELDRDPFSTTYGSFDREYWAWATKDFSNIDLQRAIYPLTTVYLSSLPDNPWHGQPRVRDWISAAFEFWRRAQHGNGSHDHHFPNEFSFVGVGFPLYETAEAFSRLDAAGGFAEDERQRWLETMAKGADFLCRSEELHGFISNHRMGAACGLQLMAGLTGENRYRRRAEDLVASVRARVSAAEGWPSEYGGADPGYQTLCTYYLANYWRITGDEEFLDKVIAPSVRFLQYFVHPDGSVGGEYGSRNCSLVFPGGLELLAKRLPEAEAIAAKVTEGIAAGMSPALPDHDIRNFVPMLSSYAQAMITTVDDRQAEPVVLPCERETERCFPEAGMFVRSDHRHYTVIGLNKGGVVKVFDKADGRMLASHGGYMIEFRDGGSGSNQFLSPGEIEGEEDCRLDETEPRADRHIDGRHVVFTVIRDRTMSQLKFLLFRIFNFTIGRNMFLADWVKRNIITGIFIHRRRTLSVKLERRVRFEADGPVIEDRLTDLPDGLQSLRAGDIFTTIYMASSKYYRHQEMLPDTLSRRDLAAEARQGVLTWHLGERGWRLSS